MSNIQDDYKNSTTVYSKSLYNGGRVFCKYNNRSKKFVFGNTAATAVSDGNSAIQLHGLLVKDVRYMQRQLDNLGYTEFKVNYKNKVDTYEQIRKAGL